jgi:acyl-CoA thioester hydrolase
MASRKVSPWPADILANLAVMRASHALLPRPDALGRVIGVRPRAEAETVNRPETRH